MIEQSTLRQSGHLDRANGRVCARLLDPDKADELKALRRDLDGILVEYEQPGADGSTLVVFRHASTKRYKLADGSYHVVPGPYGYAEMVQAGGMWKVCGVHEGQPEHS